MALIEINRLIDTILTFITDEQAAYDTLIANYLGDRFFLNTFKGIRKSLPVSSMPALEVGPVGDQLSWHSVRVQEDTMALEIHISTNNGNPVAAIDLEGKLVALTMRILTVPAHLRPQIQGYQTWLYDSPLPSVQYGATAANGNMRVAKISWSGKALEYLTDPMFPPFLQGGGGWPV
jgi:hypothetical protein